MTYDENNDPRMDHLAFSKGRPSKRRITGYNDLMSEDSPKRRRRQNDLHGSADLDGYWSWIKAAEKARKNDSRLLIVAWQWHPQTGRSYDLHTLPLRATENEVERIFPYSKPRVTKSIANVLSRCHAKLEAAVVALIIDLPAIEGFLCREHHGLRMGRLVSAEITSLQRGVIARVKVGPSLEKFDASIQCSDSADLEHYRLGQYVICRVVAIDVEKRHVTLIPEPKTADPLLDAIVPSIEQSVCGFLDRFLTRERGPLKAPTVEQSPSPWKHRVLASTVMPVDADGVTSCANAIGALDGMDDKARESCLAWLMTRIGIKKPEPAPELTAARLPELTPFDKVVQPLRELISYLEPRRTKLAQRVERLLNSMGVVEPATIEDGKAIAELVNGILLGYGLRLQLEKDGTIYPGTLEYPIERKTRGGKTKVYQHGFCVLGSLPGKQFRSYLKNDFRLIKVIPLPHSS